MADDDRTNPLAQVLGRLGLPADQIAGLQHQLGRVLMPGEQLQTMRDLVVTFAPSLDQLHAIENQLEMQRTQLEAMLGQLDEMEATLERLTSTAEQLRAMQEPFLRVTRFFNPDDRER